MAELCDCFCKSRVMVWGISSLEGYLFSHNHKNLRDFKYLPFPISGGKTLEIATDNMAQSWLHLNRTL